MARNSRGLTSFDVLLVVALAGVALLTVVPKWRVDRIIAAEEVVVGDIKDLSERIDAARVAAQRDLDGDGRGETPPLGDVLGSRSAHFERSVDGAAWRHGGYWFTVLVPGSGGHPEPPSDDPSLADYSEATYLLVAWPVEPGRSGMRAYARTPLDGTLRHAVDGYPYGGPDHPPLPRESLVVVEAGGVRPRRIWVEGGDSPWRSPREPL